MVQRLNAVVPGRWRQEFKTIDPPPGSKRLYMLCRLIVTLPITEGDPDVEAVYEDVGEMDGASRAGLKALYSDSRKRAAVAAGIGAYLYTALEAVVLPIGPNDRQVQVIRRSGKPDVLALSPGTEQWLRHGYQQRMSTEAVRRDLGEILSHGEPEHGMGQGEAAEQRPTNRRDRRSGTASSRPNRRNGPTRQQCTQPRPSATPSQGQRRRARRVSRPRAGRRLTILTEGDLMSDLVLAGPVTDVPVTAAELAARIPVPRRLPERYDGEPLRHLSASSYSLWVSCPEA